MEKNEIYYRNIMIISVLSAIIVSMITIYDRITDPVRVQNAKLELLLNELQDYKKIQTSQHSLLNNRVKLLEQGAWMKWEDYRMFLNRPEQYPGYSSGSDLQKE